MQSARWLPYGVLTLAWMMLIYMETASGFSLQTGIHNMAWGSSVADHAHLTRVRGKGRIGYYVNHDMLYRLTNEPVPGVIYGFYADRLFAVYIKLGSPNQGYYIANAFSDEHGPPKVKTSAAGDLTVYRWQDADVKIKLKINQSKDEFKLGIYYTPIASLVHQDQVEEAPVDTFENAPENVRPTKAQPLL